MNSVLGERGGRLVAYSQENVHQTHSLAELALMTCTAAVLAHLPACTIEHFGGTVYCTGANDAHGDPNSHCATGFTYVDVTGGNDQCVDYGCPAHAVGAPDQCACDPGFYPDPVLAAPTDGNWTGTCNGVCLDRPVY